MYLISDCGVRARQGRRLVRVREDKSEGSERIRWNKSEGKSDDKSEAKSDSRRG